MVKGNLKIHINLEGTLLFLANSLISAAHTLTTSLEDEEVEGSFMFTFSLWAYEIVSIADSSVGQESQRHWTLYMQEMGLSDVFKAGFSLDFMNKNQQSWTFIWILES
jgi:hypothetical protein